MRHAKTAHDVRYPAIISFMIVCALGALCYWLLWVLFGKYVLAIALCGIACVHLVGKFTTASERVHRICKRCGTKTSFVTDDGICHACVERDVYED